MMTFVVFAAINLSPQSAIDQFILNPKIPAQVVEQEKERTGYYESLPVRYIRWLMGVLGDIRLGRDRKVLVRYTDQKGFSGTYMARGWFSPEFDEVTLKPGDEPVDLVARSGGRDGLEPWLDQVLKVSVRVGTTDAETTVLLKATFAGTDEVVEKSVSLPPGPAPTAEAPRAFDVALTRGDLQGKDLTMAELASLEVSLAKGSQVRLTALEYQLDAFRFPSIDVSGLETGETRTERMRPYLIVDLRGPGHRFEMHKLESPYTSRYIPGEDWQPLKRVPKQAPDGTVEVDDQGEPVLVRKVLKYDEQGQPVYRERGFRALELGLTNYTHEMIEMSVVVLSGLEPMGKGLHETRFPVRLPPRESTDVELAFSKLEEEGVDLEHIKGLALQADKPGKVALNRVVLVEDQSIIGVRGLPNFGVSYRDGRPVLNKIFSAVGNTILLLLSAMFITWMVALPAGIAAAVRQYKVSDKVLSFLSFVGMAMPSFFLAVLIRLLAKQYVPWLPNAGRTSEGYPDMMWIQKIIDLAAHAALPVLTMALGGMAGLQRIMRANMLENQRQQYVTTARAKGLSERVVTYKHVLRNAITPFVASFGSFFPALLGGSLFIEIIFNYPGVGKLMYEAVLHRDQNMIMANTLFVALLLVVGNLVADILLAIVDPRVSYD